MIYGLVVIIPASTANYARVFENLSARGHRAPAPDFEMFSMEGNQLNVIFYAHSARLALVEKFYFRNEFCNIECSLEIYL